jgi:SsrA-binding protein
VAKPASKPVSKNKTDEILICENRRAKFDYEFDDTLEAGLVLTGSEVNSLRNGEAHLSDSYAMPLKNEFFLHNAHIGAYKAAANYGHTPTRVRKLLLNRNEIEKWSAKVRERGYSVIPMSMYFKNGRAKLKLGLGRGKKTIDRRETIKSRESQREVDRVGKIGRR